jgi:glycosyltransferase involved in cell wall biosynthesis
MPASRGMIDPTLRLLVWYWGRRGGGPRYALELLRALEARDDVEVAVTLSQGNEALAEFGDLSSRQYLVDTYDDIPSFIGASMRLPAIRRRFAELIRRSQADIVVSIMPHPWSWYLAQAVPRAGARLISIIHDATRHPGEPNPFWGWRTGRELAATSGTIVLSQHVRAQLIEQYRYPPDRIGVIPLGPFAYAAPEAEPRRFPRGRRFRFLFFGRLLSYKGIPLLLDAFRQLAAEREDVELHIVGNGTMAPYRAQLDGLPRVTVINRWLADHEIGEHLASADALVASYTEASQSAAIAAAYGSGLPVIATPVGGLIEQVRPGVTGLIAKSVSAPDFAAAMRALLAPDLYERCAAGAWDQKSQPATWQHAAAQLVDLCHRLGRP